MLTSWLYRPLLQEYEICLTAGLEFGGLGEGAIIDDEDGSEGAEPRFDTAPC